VIAEIVSLSGYEAQASQLLREDERMAMEFYIAIAPEDDPVICGSGGFRKALWARRGGGKSGGFRVIYLFLAAPAADQNVLAKLAAQIKKSSKGGR
jgi:hypothetical protein